MRLVSGGMLAGAKQAVWRTRLVQRKPGSERWSSGAAKMVGGVPRHTLADDRIEKLREAAEESLLRRTTTACADLEHYGFTTGCLGCRAWLIVRSRQGHPVECSQHLEKEMQNGPRLQQPRWRESDFLARSLQREGAVQMQSGRRGEHRPSDSSRGVRFRLSAVVRFCSADACGELAVDWRAQARLGALGQAGRQEAAQPEACIEADHEARRGELRGQPPRVGWGVSAGGAWANMEYVVV